MSNSYYESTAISQSKIKTFLESRETYYYVYVCNNKPEDLNHLAFGRYYHTLILEPDKISEKYVIDSGLKVNGKMGIFIEEYFRTGNEKLAHTLSEFDWSLEKVMHDFNDVKKETNKKYFEFLKSLEGKELISKDDYYKGQRMLANFGQDCRNILNPESDDCIIHTEYYIKWFVPYAALELKSLLDRVVINHTKRTITIVDLKTTKVKNIRNFSYECKKYKYHIQAAFYKSAVEYLLYTEWSDLKDYTIDFIFIPQCTEAPYHTLRPFRLTEEDMQKAYMEYRQALIDIETCVITNYWKSDYDILDSQGVATLSLNI